MKQQRTEMVLPRGHQSRYRISNAIIISGRTFKETACLWIRLARLRFLAYSPIEYGLGISIANFASGTASLSLLKHVRGALLVLAIHTMTHFFNEYHDYDTDCRNLVTNAWTGGSGVLPRHPDMLDACHNIAWVLFGVCTMLASTLNNFGASAVGLLAVLVSWQYSAPPFRLNGGVGVGEATVALVLTCLTPLFGFFMAMGGVPPSAASLMTLTGTLAPLCTLAFSRQLMMNIPDIDADLAVNKRNICGRIGALAARRIFAAGTILSYVTLWVATSLWGVIPYKVACLQSATLPLALVLTRVALSKNKSDLWLTQANVPFLASMNLSLFASLGLVGFHFSRPAASCLACLWPVAVFTIATGVAFKKVINMTTNDATVSLMGWRKNTS